MCGLFDVKSFAAADAKRLIGDQLATLAEKGKIPAASVKAAVARIALPESLAGLSDADLVIEAIVEQLDAKRALVASLDAIVGRECILATNTSSLSVTAIASASAHPGARGGPAFLQPGSADEGRRGDFRPADRAGGDRAPRRIRVGARPHASESAGHARIHRQPRRAWLRHRGPCASSAKASLHRRPSTAYSSSRRDFAWALSSCWISPASTFPIR